MGNKTKKYFWFALPPIFLVSIYFFVFHFIESPPANINRQINILANTSFYSEGGPGPEISKIFEKEFNVKVNWLKTRSNGLLIDRIRFSRAGTYDIVVGLDDLQLDSASKMASWKGIFLPNIDWIDNLPFGAVKRQFIPIDWSVLSFVYRKDEISPPKNFEDLLQDKFKNKVFIQDPRSSSPGLHFLGWILAQKGEEEAFSFLRKFKKNWQKIPISWSSSYELFQKTKASIVFSYVTSPIYHWKKEKDFTYTYKLFDDGNPYQIEYAAVSRKCKNCTMASQFINFLLRPKIQKIIMEKNFMFPVIKNVTKGTSFHKILKSTDLKFKNFKDLEVRKEYYLKKWKDIY